MDLNPQQQDVHLLHYWNVIRKRWKVAMAILAVVMIGTFLASYFSKPLYLATIRIQIERETNSVTIEDIFGIAASEQEFLKTEYVLLQSRGLALRVVDDHKLYNDPELYPQGVAGKTPAELQTIKEGIAGGLLGGISVDAVSGTSLVDISYVGSSPRLAQKIAEAWGESFMRMNIAKKLDAVQQAESFLNVQIATVQTDLESGRHELQEYGRSRGIISMGEGNNGDDVVMSKLGQLNRDLTNAQQIVFQREAALGALQRTAADAIASGDPMVQRLSEDVGRMQREYSDKLATMKEGHPEMKRLANQIEKTRAARAVAVQQAYSKQVEAARAEYTAAVSQQNSIKSAYDQQRTEAQRLNVDSARYFDLRMAVETKQTLLATLQKQLSHLERSLGRSFANRPPTQPVDEEESPECIPPGNDPRVCGDLLPRVHGPIRQDTRGVGAPDALRFAGRDPLGIVDVAAPGWIWSRVWPCLAKAARGRDGGQDCRRRVDPAHGCTLARLGGLPRVPHFAFARFRHVAESHRHHLIVRA